MIKLLPGTSETETSAKTSWFVARIVKRFSLYDRTRRCSQSLYLGNKFYLTFLTWVIEILCIRVTVFLCKDNRTAKHGELFPFLLLLGNICVQLRLKIFLFFHDSEAIPKPRRNSDIKNSKDDRQLNE